MKIELIYDGEGNLTIVSGDSVDFYYVETWYQMPEKLDNILATIPKYKELEGD